MSRCFPFPPPGYEKKLVIDDPDLLKKEKRREKKHKKDKKDKDKKDGKVKKEKNRSEGKHKEKKDEHRDKKKDKEKSDTSTPDDKNIYGLPKGYNGERLYHNNEHNKEKYDSTNYKKSPIQFPQQNGDFLRNKIKVVDAENCKFVQDLDRRIRDEKNGTGSHQFVFEDGKNNVNKFEMQRTDGRQAVTDVAGFSGNVAGFSGNVVVPNRISGVTPPPLDNRQMQLTNVERDKQKQRKDKEMEKLKEKSEQKKANNSSTRPLDNGFLGVSNLKKRKDMETNGGSHENELRPNKMARPVSNISPENGRKLDFSQSVSPHLLDKKGAPQNSLKVGSKGGQRVNGMITSQPVSIPAKKPPIPAMNNSPSKPSVKSPPVITTHVAAQSPPVSTPHHHLPPLSSPPTTVKQPPISRLKPPPPLPTPKRKPPHPDTKYLNQILSVPKPNQWCAFDDQEWLFTSKARSASNKPPTDDLEVQVWSEAKHIKSVDVCALPYVIPY